MKKLHKRIVAWSVVICLALLVLPIPNGILPNIPYSDKIIHFLIFAYITYVVSRITHFWSAALFAILLGLATEFIQCSLFWRSGTFGDFTADAAGAVSAYIVLKLFSHWKY